MHAKNLKIGFGFTTAMAAVLLTGCASSPAPRAQVSAAAAQRDMDRGMHDRAIQHAEAAVAAEPHNGTFRMVLGEAYLDAGRFASAETTFVDAMDLGEQTPRAALSLALAQIAQAKYASAASLLGAWEGRIANADTGLAMALAGQPERGIHIMSNAIRSGENTVKMRQNLAYSYAMAGRWREARLMAQQDVPAGEVGQRLEQWAAMAPSEAYRSRIATLLGVPVDAADGGQPAYLALINNPSVEQLAAEAVREPASQPELAFSEPVQSMQTVAIAPSLAELPAAGPVAVAPQPIVARPAAANSDFATAFAPAPALQAAVSLDARNFVSDPEVQPVHAPAATAPRAAGQNASFANTNFSDSGLGTPAPVLDGTHLVQLGSFLSEQGARRAWDIYLSRYPELADREMVITQAVVRGRNYWRVSAGGYDQRASRAMCSRVQSSGNGCFAWAEGRPLPGAIDSGVRFARR